MGGDLSRDDGGDLNLFVISEISVGLVLVVYE